MLPADKYKVAFEKGDTKLYVPLNPSDYHLSRYIELNNHMIYANSGTTKDVLKQAIEGILERVNSDKPIASTRSDIAVLCNNIMYRMQHPVDELASLRMGAVLCFMEGEDPDTVNGFWLNKKMMLANTDPDFYTFFLTTGIAQQKQFNPSLNISITEDYLKNRQATLETLKPLKS